MRQPSIRPRSDWGADLPARGSLQAEEDVRFLLVHHTASANAGPDASVTALRGFYAFHTGPEKGWPDIAYNFLIDSGGQIWEGRTGSLAGPVRGDATGGSQGHALLCCFIGDFTSVAPTPAAVDAMTQLLAWLADRYAVSLAEGATVTFTSRGSNRWPAGASVTTPTISGHRDMSQTSCPGDTAYAMLDSTIRPGARSLLAAASPTPTPTSSPTPPPEPTATPTPNLTPSASPEPTTSGPSATPAVASKTAPPDEGWPWPATVGGAVGAATLAGLGWVLRRRMVAGDNLNPESSGADQGD